MAFPTETSEVQVVTDAFSERTKIVEKLLDPHNETDQAGFKRRVYKQGKTAFSFRGREELPTVEAMKGSQTMLLGSDPVHIDTGSYQEYKSQYVAAERDEEICVSALTRLGYSFDVQLQTK